ncbi:glycosyltransferase [Sinomicrobium soli]|uniref:glycosyltransferase n=1 Tax=Sinomicrobium sp. N-1-3-6 TaxID=2219864 RepID=UPI000DCEA859|nr:glycosyltransferase [Sinomicrobium sp. N-1-3-6]RAV29409.1 glycosyltransferase family 1 protein [Sinomicrobium sp. N-1-3-6]
MKVVHIVEALGGGVYSYLKDLGEYFRNHSSGRIENYLIYSANRKETDSQKIRSEFSTHFELIEVSMVREISFFKDVHALYSLVRLLKKIDPDIIHLHSSKAGALGRIANAFTSKKRVVYYSPHGYSFVRTDISKSKRKLFWLIEKCMTLFFGGTTIACGDTEQEYARQIGPAILIRNGIDIKTIIKKNKEKNRPYTIGTIGRICPQKHPELFNCIALKFPEIQFIWIGDGDQRSLLNSPNISITGWLPRETALDLVNDFHIYIQTSLWEGLPYTIIEAMALEKPVIATNVIGNKDAVEDGFSGYLCSDISEFEKAITTIRETPSLEQRMGSRSRLRAEKLFNKDVNFKQLEDLYLNRH